MLLNEVYFGKTKEFEMLEGFLKSYIKKDEDVFDDDRFFKDLKLVKGNIEKAFGKRFNINLNLHISVDPFGLPASYVIKMIPPIIEILTPTDIIEKTSNGFRFRERTVIDIFMSSSLIKILNERELIAVLLHEVGHSMFFQNIFGRIITLLLSPAILVLKELKIVYAEFLKATDDNKDNKRREMRNKIIFKAFRVFMTLDKYYQQFKKFIGFKDFFERMLKIILIIPKFSLKTIFEYLLKQFLSGSYANEEFADNFANVHGYGHDLVKALLKFNIPKLPLYEKTFFLLDDILGFYSVTLDSVFTGVHPQFLTRFYNTENFIKKELHSETNPEKIKLLKKELENLKIFSEKMKKDISFLEGSGFEVFSLIDIYKKIILTAGQSNIDSFDKKVISPNLSSLNKKIHNIGKSKDNEFDEKD